VGHRIIPKDHRERFVRPTVINQHLCKLRNVPRLVETGKSLSQAGDNAQQSPHEMKRSASLASDGNKSGKKKQKSRQKAVLISSESEQSPGRLDRWTDLGMFLEVILVVCYTV
jgi:hypothetical protein